MVEENTQQPEHSFPNSDRPLDSKEPIKSAVGTPPENKETVKFKEVMEHQSEKFIHDDKLDTIETYNTDFAKAIRKDNVSALQIALAEKKKQDEMGVNSQVPDKAEMSLRVKIIGGVTLLVVLVGGYFLASWIFAKGQTPENVANQNTTNQSTDQTPLIKIDQKQIVQIDGKDDIAIKKEILKFVNGTVDTATIKELILAAQPTAGSKAGDLNKITTSQFFDNLHTHASPQLIRALADNYTMGVYGSSPRDFFIIFNVKSQDNAFAGMLTWESYMNDDVGDIFERNFKTAGFTNGTSTGSSTKLTQPVETSNQSITNQRVFSDKIFYNKDTRVIYDTEGKIKILYSFIDPKTLVLVSSDTGFKEILSRLTTGRITR